MKRDLTLLIMAAGMGSRFGGLKQIEPIGPNGEFIIDYSVYDAIKAGFTKIVFIIKEENYDLFKETIGKRIEKQNIKIEYVFQRQDDVPEGVIIPKDRTKPWGTSHAILAAKNNINEDFLVLNADDFYGREAFLKAVEFFNERKENEYGIIGYKIKNTISENGSVKRGICEEKDGYLEKITECSVERVDNRIIASPLNGNEPFEIGEDTLTSMNLFCFTKDIFKYLEDNLSKFFEDNKDDLSKCEYLIPESVYNCIKDGLKQVKIVPTSAKWQGVTYKEDKEKVVEGINDLIKDGTYPNNLWV